MSEDAITVDLEGAVAAAALLGMNLQQMRTIIRNVMTRKAVQLRGDVVRGFGMPGRPQRRTGALSRGVRAFVEDRGGPAVSMYLGESASVPYGRILEFGGTQPGRWVSPKRAHALRWYTGMRRMALMAALGRGATYKQAAVAARRVRRGRGRAGRRMDVGHYIPKRVQRAMPYLTPPFLAGIRSLPDDLRTAFAAAHKARQAVKT